MSKNNNLVSFALVLLAVLAIGSVGVNTQGEKSFLQDLWCDIEDGDSIDFLMAIELDTNTYDQEEEDAHFLGVKNFVHDGEQVKAILRIVKDEDGEPATISGELFHADETIETITDLPLTGEIEADEVHTFYQHIAFIAKEGEDDVQTLHWLKV